MRSLLVAAALGAAVPSLPAPSASASSGPLIICPDLNGSLGCCGPPVAEPQDSARGTTSCCSPVAGGPSCCAGAPCPGTLLIAATPDPAADGNDATISGRLTGAPVAAQPIVLYQRLAGEQAFGEVANTQTDSSGAYRLTVPVQTNAEWYTAAGSIVSSTLTEPVRAAVALSLRPVAGARIELSGSVAPSHAGERVAVQQLRHGRWETIARPLLDGRSRFAVARRLVIRSVARFRAVLAADARNSRSVSAVGVLTT